MIEVIGKTPQQSQSFSDLCQKLGDKELLNLRLQLGTPHLKSLTEPLKFPIHL